MLNFDKGGSSVRSFVGWLVWEGGNMRKSTGSVITGIVCRCCLRPIHRSTLRLPRINSESCSLFPVFTIGGSVGRTRRTDGRTDPFRSERILGAL